MRVQPSDRSRAPRPAPPRCRAPCFLQRRAQPAYIFPAQLGAGKTPKYIWEAISHEVRGLGLADAPACAPDGWFRV